MLQDPGGLVLWRSVAIGHIAPAKRSRAVDQRYFHAAHAGQFKLRLRGVARQLACDYRRRLSASRSPSSLICCWSLYRGLSKSDAHACAVFLYELHSCSFDCFLKFGLGLLIGDGRRGSTLKPYRKMTSGNFIRHGMTSRAAAPWYVYWKTNGILGPTGEVARLR
jgi:hypothetical protein